MYSQLHGIVHQVCTGEFALSLPIIRMAQGKPMQSGLHCEVERLSLRHRGVKVWVSVADFPQARFWPINKRDRFGSDKRVCRY